MQEYFYKMIDEEGKEKNGSFSASSRNEVISMIRNNNCYPVEVTEKKRDNKFNLEITLKVKVKELAIFCRQMHAVLKTGAPLIKSMEIIQNNTHNKRLKRAVGNLVDGVQQGVPISQGMKKNSDVFPAILSNMIEAGEMSGTVDVVCKRMADHFEKENRIKSKVKAATTYPILLVFLTIIIAAFLLIAVMPQFMGLFENNGTDIPALTKVLMDMSSLLAKNYIWIIGSIGIGIVGYRILLNNERFRVWRDKKKVHSFILGDLRKKIVATKFTRTLSSMMRSGISIIDTMEAIASTIGNEYLKVQLLDAREKFMKGHTFSEVIDEIDGLPMMVSAMTAIGEESGEIEEIMDKTADFFDDEVEDSIKKMMALLEPMLIVFMALIIGFIVVSIMLPMFDMANAAGSI